MLLKGEDLGLEHFTLRVLHLGWSSRHCLVLSRSKADILSIIVSRTAPELSGGARALASRGCAPLVPVRIIGADSIVVDRESGASKRS